MFSPFSSVSPEVNTLIEEVKSSYRLNHSRDLLTALDPRMSMAFHNARLSSGDVEHLLVILVRNVDQMQPSRAQYLLPLTTYLHEMVARDTDTGMFLCDTTTHYNPILQNLTTYFPSYQIENTDYVQNKLMNYTSDNNRLKNSFINCLKLASEITTSPKVFTVFNENILPYEYFRRDIKGIIKNKLDNKLLSGEYVPNRDKWLFLHLQEPANFRVYHCDFASFLELFIIAAIGSLIFHAIYQLIDNQMSSSNVVFTLMYGGVFFLTCALSLGRPYVAELRRYACSLYKVYDPPEAVHFSALTVSSSSYERMEPHLRTISCSDYVGFHEVLDSMINTLEIPGYVISPSLVRYV